MSAATAPERVLFLLVDGVGDLTIPDLGDRTPLEVAHTPNLDALAGGQGTLQGTDCAGCLLLCTALAPSIMTAYASTVLALLATPRTHQLLGHHLGRLAGLQACWAVAGVCGSWPRHVLCAACYACSRRPERAAGPSGARPRVRQRHSAHVPLWIRSTQVWGRAGRGRVGCVVLCTQLACLSWPASWHGMQAVAMVHAGTLPGWLSTRAGRVCSGERSAPA